MDPRKDILWRVYAVYFFICLFGLAIILQVCRLQFIQGSYWKAKADSLTTSYKSIDAARGNIYTSDGSLLGTSIPVYEMRMDVNADALTDEVFNREVDSLSMCLSGLFKEKSWKEQKKELVKARKDGEQYFLIHRNVSYDDLKQARHFPMFRMGRYKGGLIVSEQSKRARPFDKLAARTLGYEKEGISPVGLEGAYNNYLEGTGGKRLMQKISGNVWMPINDDNEVEPQDGSDIWSTIDINIQDVAESALLKQLSEHNAEHGCAVLMEVETGEIKAIANLSRDLSGEYNESYNFAIGESTEPGSTFKIASLIAAMEDGLVNPTDSVDTEHGQKKYYDKVMHDSHESFPSKMTVQKAFEVSSNVGISKVIVQHYQGRQQDFVNAICRMNLNQPLALEISGETGPLVKTTKDKDWSGVTLPWMSIGYEVRLTPLQILTFYNAIANNGKMVKPIFVREITLRGKEVRKFSPQVINPAICSPKTIERAKRLLEGVVERGTASNLKNPNYRIAGKTGTAQIANRDYGYKFKSQVNYQASFVGYFPAENPKYSCIVVVNSPSNDVYYANLVAGPVFKEIADRVFASRMEMHKEYAGELSADKGKDKEKGKKTVIPNPVLATGNREEIQRIAKTIGLRTSTDDKNAEWIEARGKDSLVSMNKCRAGKGVPNVQGMGMRDAIYLLETSGLQVKATGKGIVKKQSLVPGTIVEKGSEIKIELL